MAWHREDQTSQCLATIPGIGPIGGVSFALKSLPPRRRGCRTRRPFARAGTLRRGSASRRARIPQRANTGLARLAERATRAYDGCLCSGRPRSSSKLSPAAPRRGSWDCWRASRRSSRRWRWPTKPAPAQAGDGPHHLGHDGERRDLPSSEGGLSPPTRDTWHWQGQQQQDGDRSIRGSGQPGESIGAQTSRSCLGPDPRNPSGPAVSPTAPQKPALAKAGGRTYDRNRPDRPSCQHLASRGPSTYDAAAICEAMSRPVLGLDPGMRFVPVKTAERQAALMLKVRDLLVKQRTMLINALRGHAAEFGVTAPKSLPSRKRGGHSRWPSCFGGWLPKRACRRWRARCSACWRASSRC